MALRRRKRTSRRGGRRSTRKGRGLRRRGGRRSKGISRVGKEIREMKDITQPITTLYDWGTRYFQDSAGGYQLLMPLLQWNDSQDISQLHNNLLVQLNPGSGTSIPLNKFAVGDYSARFTIKNMTNMDFTYDLYTCVARDDMDYQQCPTNNWSPLGAVQYANVYMQFFSGLQEIGLSGVGFSNFPLSLTPYDVPKFCSYFKIIKKKLNQKMIGGGFKTYIVRDKKWRMWNGTKIFAATNAQNVTDVVFGKRTKFVFALARGQAISDITNSNSLAIAPVNVAVTGSERYMFTGIANSVKRLFITSVYNTIANGNISTIDLQTEVAAGLVTA